MTALRVFTASLTILTATASARADDPNPASRNGSPSAGTKELPNPQMLVGKWVRTDKYVGTTMVFDPNGTSKTTFIYKDPRKPMTNGGTWKLKGDQLFQTINGPYRTETLVRVTRLTKTEFKFVNTAGQEASYVRVDEKKSVTP